MRLYVWRSPWDGMWWVTRDPKPLVSILAHLRRDDSARFLTHAEAFADAWARTHPKVAFVPIDSDTYRVVGAMPRSAVTGRYKVDTPGS